MTLRKFFLIFAPVLLVACKPTPTVTSFQECVDAGNPVMESYPRQCRTTNGDLFVEDLGQSDLIRVSSPQSNESIEETFVVEGEARGNWFFEATFPIRLIDSQNNELLSSYIMTAADWMTTDFVPFSAEFTVDFGSATEGTLILMKDNPSGLPENAAEIRIPVQFNPSDE